ncbi:pyruvate dehydrogenase (acetyl-transferring) E1 component subunit alpha [Plantibacter sp. CFBP 13570]|uniref:pyruvate dehydrogenase (acetyl-transferring) E1 component subunit alpha n=1 Tax=Plantibacter sp. CFBP 13570 TaxID=2775272 RepID=UPI001930AEC2|nr:pyruvate dehydrogenase (acetyl-transferring) E1 component subunit alpha [Plantibacter sp. CFBP 13570]MBD8537167.1 pyruvate dehydrogenase (acetyl-transferring) E1 component subunit alpha [Plantibacter sp. CFBP 13570]
METHTQFPQDSDERGGDAREPVPVDQGCVQLLDPDGVRQEDALYDLFVADLGHTELLALYEDMVVTRRIDTEATALQRQGEIGLWPPSLGQEAAQVGSARVLRRGDFVFTSYREQAVAYCRGVELDQLMAMWRGTALSGWDPFAVGMATPAVIIGAQTLHATGYAMGCQRDGSDAVAVAYFGDGATSQGDVNEALVLAASFQAPVVFFCQNNQYAISEPVGLQAQRPIADRAPGFGVPSMRVDGNDVIAVTAAMRIAVDRARSGGGPTFIEAVTYRMGPHTTSDDPTRYRDESEVASWRAKDPIARLERLLESEGVLDETARAHVASVADSAAARVRAGCLALPAPDPLSLFDEVYATAHPGLERQREEYRSYLAMFDGGAR